MKKSTIATFLSTAVSGFLDAEEINATPVIWYTLFFGPTAARAVFEGVKTYAAKAKIRYWLNHPITFKEKLDEKKKVIRSKLEQKLGANHRYSETEISEATTEFIENYSQKDYAKDIAKDSAKQAVASGIDTVIGYGIGYAIGKAIKPLL